jgi:hypothetical protein
LGKCSAITRGGNIASYIGGELMKTPEVAIRFPLPCLPIGDGKLEAGFTSPSYM